MTPNDSVSQNFLADERDLTGWRNLPQPVQRPLPQPVQRPIAKAEPALHAALGIRARRPALEAHKGVRGPGTEAADGIQCAAGH